MKRNIRRKIGQFLTSKVSPLAMFVGCLFVCIVIAGSVAVANNDNNNDNITVNITVNSGGVLNLSNERASDNLGYSVAITNDSGVDASFSNDVDVVGDLTAGTITSDAGILGTTANFSATSTFTGNIMADRIFEGGGAYASTTSKAFTLDASTICDNNKISIQYVSSTADSVAITLPATSSVSAYCLETVGQELSFNFYNSNTFASTTVLTVNTDYNFYYSATSTTINSNKKAEVNCRRSATAYDCDIVQLQNR